MKPVSPRQRQRTDERRESLYRTLAESFPLRSIDVETDRGKFSLYAPESIDLLIDMIRVEDFRKDERVPYWAELWHSAVALSRFLERNPKIVEGKDVLEIGCGLGLTGIVAARLGAKTTFSDFESLALVAAELNFLLNDADAEAEFLQLDFRDPPQRCWDVILAADVIYEKRFIEPLSAFLRQALDEESIALIAEPNRMIAIPFFQKLQSLGLRSRRFEQEAFLHGHRVHVSIYAIARRNIEGIFTTG